MYGSKRKEYKRPTNPQNPPIKINMNHVSLEDRVKCVRYFYRYGDSIAQRTYNYWKRLNLKNKIKIPPPSRNSIADINKKFATTGSVANLAPSQDKLKAKKEKRDKRAAFIRQAFLKNPELRVKDLAEEMGLSKATVSSIRKEYGMPLKNYTDPVAKKLKTKIARLEERIARLEREDIQKRAAAVGGNHSNNNVIPAAVDS